MLNSVGGLIRKRYLRRVEPLVNTVLMSYRLHIFWILSVSLFHIGLTYCREFSGIVLFPSIQVIQIENCFKPLLRMQKRNL